MSSSRADRAHNLLADHSPAVRARSQDPTPRFALDVPHASFLSRAGRSPDGEEGAGRPGGGLGNAGLITFAGLEADNLKGNAHNMGAHNLGGEEIRRENRALERRVEGFRGEASVLRDEQVRERDQ